CCGSPTGLPFSCLEGGEMPDWENNVYNHPERYGLKIVGEVEWSVPCYSFDFTLVLEDGDGNLWWGSDSGCSCPSPFEEHEFPEDFETGSKYELVKHIKTRTSRVFESDRVYATKNVTDSLFRLFDRSGGAKSAFTWKPVVLVVCDLLDSQVDRCNQLVVVRGVYAARRLFVARYRCGCRG